MLSTEEENAFKSISGYTKVKVTVEYLYLV